VEYLRVPLVYFNTSPRGEIDGTRYELAVPWKSRRLGADFDNTKKEKKRERERERERERGRKRGRKGGRKMRKERAG
jgi:hypothetical protein